MSTTQLDILKRLKLGKSLVQKSTNRVKWTVEHELAAFTLYCNPSYSNELVEALAVSIGHSKDSVKMKMGNIDAVVSGQNRGLSHISKLTIDVVAQNKHLLK